MAKPQLLDRLRRCSSAVSLAMIVVLVFPLVGRTEITLGAKTFQFHAAPPLMNHSRVRVGLGSFRFLGRVGGVAFGGMATGAHDEEVVALTYNMEEENGERLKVTLEDASGFQTTVNAPIYDWQLVPIARFAATEQDACFTLFGELKDAQQGEALQIKGHRVLNYHPAFTDTLMGLRLLQASNSRPKGPLGRKRDEEAIWGNLLKTRTNRTSCRQVPCRGKTPMFTKAESAQPYKYRLFAVTGNC